MKNGFKYLLAMGLGAYMMFNYMYRTVTRKVIDDLKKTDDKKPEEA